MDYDTLIIGAGAAGLMAAGRAGGRVLLIDHAKAAGEKIRISGGGRCNFTNIHAEPANFISANPHFHKSALSRFTPWDFVAMVDAHGIAWHEKTLGQLFCDGKATQIIDMLVGLGRKAGAEIRLGCALISLDKADTGFSAVIDSDGKRATVSARNVVVASGGKSIPKMGATGLAYEVASKFGHEVTETRPGLVPFTFSNQPFAGMSGTATNARVTAGHTTFEEAVLFTHRGLSGPAILQASSYWHEGDTVTLDLIAGRPLFDDLRDQRQREGRRNLTTELSRHIAAKLVDHLTPVLRLSGNLADQSDARLAEICTALSHWALKPTATEGYRTAEVTLGGVDTGGLSSKTMASKTVPGLYFIGECVDVTGWLGGFNFQWAWASAHAAAEAIRAGSRKG